MKIAIPVFASYVAPRLDYADLFLIVEVANGQILKEERWQCESGSPLARIQSLIELNIDGLICGALDSCSWRLLAASGKWVIAWQSGEVRDMLRQCLSGEIVQVRERLNHQKPNRQ